jgi:hypothetical protein
MMMIKKHLFYLFSIIFAIPLISMELKKNVRLTSNFKENYPYLVENAYQNKNYNTYAAEQFVLSQDKAIKSMNAATQRGANVYLTTGRHAQNKPREYTTTSLKQDPHAHGKLTVGLDTSPSKQKPQKGVLLFGSANTTNSTWQHKPNQPGAQFNFESGIEVQNDMDVITDAYNMVKSQSPLKPQTDKITIKNTPTKIKIYGSKDTNLNASLASRLKNAAEKEGKVSLRSMTFSDQEVAHELTKFGPNAHVIVDYSALTSKGTPLLQQMHNANVSVNVFRPFKGSHAKQHAKDAIIETNDNSMYISSTANITSEGNTQRNYQLYVPNNQQIIADAKEDFEKVKKSTISLPEALEFKQQEMEQLKRKRLEKTQESSIKKRKLNT